MNCESVIAGLGFECLDMGGEMLRIFSPFTYGKDGQAIGVYVAKTASGYRVTDAHESLMHAAAMGSVITERRMESLKDLARNRATISDTGEIYAQVGAGEIASGIVGVIDVAMSVGHFERQWKPRQRAESFTKAVEGVLERTMGEERVLRNVTVTGASGHQLELPLAVQQGSSIVYIQPIAADNDSRVDWQAVYASYGRLSDLKEAGLENSSRLVVMEDAANDADVQKAIKVLHNTASIVAYSRLPAWAAKRA